MEIFLKIITSFPTIVFTFFLGVTVLYWLCAMLGFVEIDALDVNIPEIDGQMAVSSDAEHSFGEAVAGLLMRLGLNGVPVTIVISLISLVGWLISYYLSYFSASLFGHGWFRFITGIPILAVSTYFAVRTTAFAIRPLRILFTKAEQVTVKRVLGQIAIVRSSRVDNKFGEVSFDDGGAGLIFKARTMGEEVFERGERVVLLEYREAENCYRVISEKEFIGSENQ